MNELENLTIDQLRGYKYYLISKIKELQKQTRMIDVRVKKLLKEGN